MKLSDIVAGAGLAFYAEVALVIFLIVFIAIALDVALSGKRHEGAGMLPLEDGPTPNPKPVSFETDHGIDH